MEFQTVKEFFESWGMYPNEEPTDEYNEEVIRLGINRACYGKMVEEAFEKHGLPMRKFCTHMVDATDDSFYLRVDRWSQLEKAWDEFTS